jgi:CelD/BcsL family acetyltransferase involved in cellulose biosynthesis
MIPMESLRIVRSPAELDERAWSKFVLENEKGNIFQTPEMYRVYLNTERYKPVFTAILGNNGRILATMLGVCIEEPGRMVSKFSSRVVVYGGPLVAEHSEEGQLLERILKEHNEEAGRRAVFTEIRNLWPAARLIPLFESANYEYVDHLNVHIDLTQGIDSLWEGLHKNRRRGIRKAIKSGAASVVLSRDSLDDLYSLVKQTYERIRVPMPPKSLFDSVMTILQEKGLARFVGVKLDEELVGVGVFLTYKDVIYLWYNSADRQHSSLGIGEHLFWSAIEWAVENGFRLFDFGGAGKRGQPYGVREFKTSMGGRQVELGRLVCTHSHLKAMVARAGYRVWRAIQWA